MSITIEDPEQIRPVTLYLQVVEDLRRLGVTHACLRPGAEDVIWVSQGSSSRPINCYYIFREGRLADVQVD